MGAVRIFRGLLPILLAEALVFSFLALPVNAGAVMEETAVPTQAQETVPPTAEETLPTETTPPETIPEETIPEPTQSQTVPTAVTIALAKTMAEGTADITVRGTVVYSGDGLTVLQDSSGGIRLTFPEGIRVSAGLELRVTGSRNAEGLSVTGWESVGTADLPCSEAESGSIPECTRVLLKNVSFRSGCLIRGTAEIPMTPAAPEGIREGDTVNAWGVVVDGWFYADTVTLAQPRTEQEAAVTATPLSGVLLPGETPALHCDAEGASIYYSYSYDGEFYSDFALYSGGIPADGGAEVLYIRAYARNADGTDGTQAEFYFTRRKETAPAAETGTEESSDWNLYFGQLHAHTALSDGQGTVEEAFAYASHVEGLDFFAVTDHSNSLDNADAGSILTDGSAVSAEWAAGKAAAERVTDGDFVGIFGYEMTWRDRQKLGHINTFHTPGWQSVSQEEFSNLERYYQALTTAPGSVSQFNHPGAAYGDFENFGHYHPKYDAAIQLLEVGSENGYTAYAYYTRALDAGWHVAPTNNQANHEGSWGDASPVRTVVLARELTEESLYDAMRNYRVYATEDRDLEIRYFMDGHIMGSILKTPAEEITVSLNDPTDTAIGTVEVIADGGAVIAAREVSTARETLTIPVSGEHTYYYLRVTQPDGDIAVTAPVWVDLTTDMGIQSFTADIQEPGQGQEIRLTLEFYNHESEAVTLEALEFYADDRLIHRAEAPGTVAGLDSFAYSVPYCHEGFGAVTFRVKVTASLSGVQQTCETTLALSYQAEVPEVPLSTVDHVRSGTLGEAYRVRGYVTAGTSKAGSTFPDTLYMQDGTGGIAVTRFTDTGIQVGAPIEVTGYLAQQDGNPVLELLGYTVPEEDYYRHVPAAVSNSDAMDMDTYGGQLLQVEGQVVSLTRTADGLGVSRFTLKDSRGDLAAVRIDDAITDSYGTNQLTFQVKTGSTVRAIGILCREADGTSVLRVRNCDEVVYVPPVADPTNPKTGLGGYFAADPRPAIAVYLLCAVLGVTATGLAALFELWKKRR